MEETAVDGVNKFGELISQYGFLVVFAATMLVIILTIAITVIKRVSKSMEMKFQQEAKKAENEASYIDERRRIEASQRDKMFDLVINVQSEQVHQLQDITNLIMIIKDEMKQTTTTINSNTESIKELNTSVNEIINNYKSIAETTSDIDKKTSIADEKLDSIIEMIIEVQKKIENIETKAN